MLAAALAVAACADPRPFTAPMRLGGRTIPAETLNAGRTGYMRYCRTCHGVDGDGQGPTGRALRPPPRDFRLGVFKFAAVPAGSLPRDEDLARIVRGGLRGTAMLSWDVPERALDDILQYLKTLSPRWRDEEPGEAIAPSPDPWGGREREAVARGERLYHGVARCLACHPAYVPRRDIEAASRELTGAPAELRPDPYGLAAQDSDYGMKIVAPDFTRSEMRSVREGRRLEDLYRVIAAGVGGTAMPTWKGALPEEDLWALVHYVDSLVAMRGTRRADELVARNRAAESALLAAPAESAR